MEIAFISSNKLKLQLEKESDTLKGKLLNIIAGDNSKFIATMLIGNNIALVIYGILMAMVLDPPIQNFLYQNFGINSEIIQLLFQTIISTLIILLAAEFIPKTLFKINPNETLSFFSVPATFFFVLLYPLVSFTIKISGFLIKTIFKLPLESGQVSFDKIDLDNYVKEITEENHKSNEEIENEIKIFKNALNFKDVKVRECLIPRNELVAVDVEESIDVLKEKFIESGHSKILIYQKSIDNIIGYIHSFEMFKKPKTIKEILINIPIVPETMPANKLLTLFTRQRKSIALVVDEFGGTSGIVTLEDVMEEIFGEIDDEYDTEEFTEKVIDDNHFLFSARLEIDYLNEKYGLKLPTAEEYETLGGLIITHHQSIPNQHDVIDIEDYRFTIEKVSKNRIEEVNIKVLQQI